MQQTPIIRAVRTTVFCIGITLFVVMAFRAGQNANDPQMVNGKPSLFSFISTGLRGDLSSGTHVAPVAEAATAQVTASKGQSSQQDAAVSHQTAPSAISGTLPVQASAQAFQAQQRAAVKQAAQVQSDDSVKVQRN